MRGRGLLIAAAVVHLGLAAGCLFPVVGLLRAGDYDGAIVASLFAMAIGATGCGLLQRLGSAWSVSFGFSLIFAIVCVVLSLAGTRMSRRQAPAPLFAAGFLANAALLFGGRRAVFATSAKTAAEPTVPTPRCGA